MKRILTAVMITALVPALAFAQQDTSRAARDSARQARGRSQGTVTQTAEGRLASSPLGLSSDQVRQLQQALNDAGCNAGTPDGIAGPKTRAAMRCARKQKGITGNDNAALYQALNLDFATTGASGSAGTTGSDTVNRDTSSSMRTDTSMRRDTATTRPPTTDTAQSPMRDTSMNRMGDSTRMRDTSMMRMRDTSMRMLDSTRMRDSLRMRDSTRMRDTTHMRDTSRTRDTTRRPPR
jgi:hypothetical protein